MGKSLDEVKEQLARKYLGRAGIHSVGISRAENAVRVYLQDDIDDEQNQLIEQIEREAAPFKIVMIKSDRPSIT